MSAEVLMRLVMSIFFSINPEIPLVVILVIFNMWICTKLPMHVEYLVSNSD